MRDNRQDIFDKEFIDNQWATMEKLLDKKLPASKPAKDTKPTLIVLSLLLSTFIGSTLFFAYKYKSTIPTAALVKEHTVYKTKYVPETRISTEAPATGKVTTKHKLDSESTENRTAKKLINQVKEFFSTELTAVEIGNEIQTTTHQLQESIVAEESLQKLAALAAIDRIESNVSSIPEDLLLEDDTYVQPAQEVEKKKRSISYNVGVETLVSTDLDFTGLGIQSGLTIPVGSRMGINTGVAVNYITKDEYFVYPLHRNQPADPKAPELRNLRQVYIPVGLNYLLTKNIALNSGLRLRYTYSDEIDGQLAAKPTRAPIEQDASFLDNTNLGLTAGFMFRVNNNFSLLLNSEWKVQGIIGAPTSLSDPQFDSNIVNLTTSFTF